MSTSNVSLCHLLTSSNLGVVNCESTTTGETTVRDGVFSFYSDSLELSWLDEGCILSGVLCGGCCSSNSSGFNARTIVTIVASLLLVVVYGLLITLVYKYRKCKALCLYRLHTIIILGSILLAASLPLKSYFICSPSGVWLRELGFICTYGGVLLVHYKSLVEWRTRKAHRWIVREKDLLRYLTLMILITAAYVASHSPRLCSNNYFTSITTISELLILIVGLYECWIIRSSNLNKYYVLLLLTDLGGGAAWGVLWGVGAVDLVGWVEIGRVVLGGIVVWGLYGGKVYSSIHESKTRPGTVQQRKIYINNDLLIENINLDEMEAGEIRSELKRVYTQLELLRSKTMRLDNPHISKRRGGRKLTTSGGGGGVGRRFSLQRKSGHNKQKKRQVQPPEITDYIEDSICSREAD